MWTTAGGRGGAVAGATSEVKANHRSNDRSLPGVRRLTGRYGGGKTNRHGPILQDALKGKDEKGADAVNGEEGTEQKPRIDEFPLGNGAVDHLRHPSGKAVRGKQNNVPYSEEHHCNLLPG